MFLFIKYSLLCFFRLYFSKGAWFCWVFLGFVEFVATTFRLEEPKRDNSCIAFVSHAGRPMTDEGFCRRTVEDSRKDLQFVSLQLV